MKIGWTCGAFDVLHAGHVLMLKEAKVAVSPGIGFGDCGEGYVRFALVENEHRINQAVRGIKKLF